MTHGDIATSAALQLSKSLGQSPKVLAEKIVAGLTGHPDVVRCEVAGPGFVNVWLRPEVFVSLLPRVLEHTNATPTRKEQPVIVEYSQPNIAKPLGVHHLLGTIIGQAVANLYRHAGFPVISWNYVGDWGTQFGKLSVAFELWGSKPVAQCSLDELLELYVRFHEELEKDASLEEKGREASRKLEQGDATLRAFWADVVTVTKNSLASVYKELHVSFDLDLGESFYEDKMAPVLEEGIAKGVFVEGDGGALIVKFPEESGMPPYLVRRGDGGTLYSTRDIAQMRYRIDTYNPQRILIFTDVAQKLHFEQLVATCQQLGWKLPPFENVLFGRMRFADKSMSTRKGNILKLEEVLNEAVSRAEAIIESRGDAIQTDDPKELAQQMGIGAVAYSILSQNRKMDMVFDWDKMLSFEGNSAPYVQYTYARTQSVLRKAGVESVELSGPVSQLADHERQLAGTLLQFPGALREALASHSPHMLANHLYQLCQDFNAFYGAQQILKADEPHRSLRLRFTEATARVLRAGAQILTIALPDRM